MTSKLALAVAVGSVTMAGTALAAPGDIYAEGFDSSGSSKVSTSQFGEVTVDYVDYSDFMTPLGGSFSVSEAPNTVAGSDPTRGVVVTVNPTQGVSSGINFFALTEAGGSPLSLTDDYILEFDVYTKIDPDSTLTTQEALWGIGNDAAGTTSYTQRGADGESDGTWGWGTSDGGWAGTGDFNVWAGDAGTPSQTLQSSDPQPTAALPAAAGYVDDGFLADADGGDDNWVTLRAVVTGGEVQVYWNDVLFFTEAANSPDGTVMFGAEDVFVSVVDNPDQQFFLFDNFTVSTIPEPASAALLGLGGLTLLRRRR